MDEIQIPAEIKTRPANIRSNIQISSKAQGIQNVNFQQLLTNIGGQEVVNNISTQSGNVTIESLLAQNISGEESGNAQNDKNIANDKNSPTSVKVQDNKNSVTNIFSSFNPQKPVIIKENLLNYLNTSKESLTRDDKNEDKQIKNQTPVNIENPIKNKIKNNSNILKKTEILQQKYLPDNKYMDTYLKSEQHVEDKIIENTYNSKIRKDNEILVPKPEPKRENNDEDTERRNKNRNWQSENLNDSEEEFLDEIENLINSYGLKKPDFKLSLKNEKNTYNDLWLKSLIFDAGKESLTNNDSEKLSKYIANQDKEIPFSDREILIELLSEIFKHKIINFDSNLSSRFEKSSIDFILRTLPPFLIKGFIKKLVSEKEERKDNDKIVSSLFNFLNGTKNSEENVKLLSSFFIEDFPLENEQKTLSSMIGGKYPQEESENITYVINKLKDNDSIPPGFIGIMYDLYLDQIKNGHLEKGKQILRLLEIYSQEKDFSKVEAKILAGMISNKYFNLKNISKNKVEEILANLMVGEKVDYLSLEIISKLSENSLLSYLPYRIDNDVRFFLKYLPFGKNEALYNNSFNEDGQIPESIIGGKVKLTGLPKSKQKNTISISLIYLPSKEIINIHTDMNGIFNEKLKVGNYQITDLKISLNEKLLIIELSKIRNFSEIFSFNIDLSQNIFYYGTLKLFLKAKTLELIKYSLKNDFKSFFDYMKNKLKISLKDRTIKINPKLIIK